MKFEPYLQYESPLRSHVSSRLRPSIRICTATCVHGIPGGSEYARTTTWEIYLFVLLPMIHSMFSIRRSYSPEHNCHGVMHTRYLSNRAGIRIYVL